MNAAIAIDIGDALRAPAPARDAAGPRIALLGTGTVGSAFVARCQTLRDAGIDVPAFAWISNSRAQQQCRADAARALREARAAPPRSGPLPPWAEGAGLRRGDVVVDATASEIVADWHPEWLARGIHVVTANKLGSGADSGRARAIERAGRDTGAHYGDSATVGAGLPLLRSIRELVRGGDRIHAVEGVLSGSLAWLFDRFDGARPFSELVRKACAAGYCEPDARIDLGGEDVRRKLLILARAAGLSLEAHAVEVESLLPSTLADRAIADVDAALPSLDRPLRERLRQAQRDRAQLCFIGSFGADGARVGLRALPPGHPLRGGRGTDNRVAIYSDRYPQRPLVIQGPGAGAEVTAAALLGDVLEIARG